MPIPLFAPDERVLEPAITLFGICWLYSLPCLASLASLFARNAQFLPVIIWGATIYNVWQYSPPVFFTLFAAVMFTLHLALYIHEDYYIPITRVNLLLGIEKNYSNNYDN